MLDRIIISSDFEVNDINFYQCIKGMKSDDVFVLGLTHRQMSDICMSKNLSHVDLLSNPNPQVTSNALFKIG